MFSSQLTNPSVVVTKLLKELKVPVNISTIKTLLTEHPDYPSLLAVSDSLSKWKVPHQTYKIEKIDYSAELLSYPFITHVKLNGGQFILVHSITQGCIRYSDERDNNAQMSESEFLIRWNGIVLYAEKSNISGEPDYKTVLLKNWVNRLRLPFLFAVLMLTMFTLMSHSYTTWNYWGLCGVKLLGTAVSILLLMQNIGVSNPRLQNLCSLGKNNCNTILASKAAMAFSWLSWSEVGLLYFAGSLISFLLHPEALNLLAWLSFACLPYTVYSIVYQIKIKNWCVLCCTAQALLWVDASLFAFEYPFAMAFNSSTIFFLIIYFMLPLAVWFSLKPLLIKSSQVYQLNQQLRKFKYNSNLFEILLTNQRHHSISEDLMPVVLGDPEAKIVITIISNPYCGPCSTAHRILDEWLDEHNDICVKIVFAIANSDDKLRMKVARHFISLNMLNDKVLIKEALSDWFEQNHKKYETWAKRYPVYINAKSEEIIAKQKAWCSMVEVQFTPTILINGYKLDDPYSLEDAKYLIT